jgi:hypothetical protein
MRAINQPQIDFTDVLQTCIDSIRSDDLTVRLNSINPQLTVAVQDYSQKVATADLFQIVPFDGDNDAIVAGSVRKKELKGLYTSHMVPASKLARTYYDQLQMSAPLNICPFCGFGHVSTLDHYLPKANFPLLSILPINLVPSCADCNKGKSNAIAVSKEEQCLHPYFDQGHFINEQWIFAEVLETFPPILTFRVVSPIHWNHDDKERIKSHFIDFKLANRFRVQAATEIPVLKGELEYDYSINQNVGVQQALERKYLAAAAQHVNWWKTAMYQALARSDWYCSGGFR